MAEILTLNSSNIFSLSWCSEIFDSVYLLICVKHNDDNTIESGLSEHESKIVIG